MEHIETIELGSSQSSITFSSIPQSYDDLIVKLLVRSTDTSVSPQNYDPFLYRLNDTNTGYSARVLSGNGSTADSSSQTTAVSSFGNNWGRLTFTGIGNSVTTASTFSSISFYISNYKASQAKSASMDLVYENNATSAGQEISAALWNNTAAVTQLAFALRFGDYAIGSTISLYGVTAGGDGTVSTA